MMYKHLLVATFLLSALASSNAQDFQEMYEKASAVTKLTSHVGAAVIFSPNGRLESDQALFDKAFEDNATLKPQLGMDVLRLLRGDKGVVILVCTADGTKSVLKDLSCTPGMDLHHWRDQPDRVCEFALGPATCQ